MDGYSGSWSQFQWLSTPSTTAFPVCVSNMKVQDVINTVSVLQSTELCHQTICACLRARTHTHTHTPQKKATGSLIYLTADSIALITVRVWHKASSCVSVDPDTFSSVFMLVCAVDFRLWHFWLTCWQLALFLGNEHITSVLVHSVPSRQKKTIYSILTAQVKSSTNSKFCIKYI